MSRSLKNLKVACAPTFKVNCKVFYKSRQLKIKFTKKKNKSINVKVAGQVDFTESPECGFS